MITWSAVTSGKFSCRLCLGGALFDSGGSSIDAKSKTEYILALLNSVIGQFYLDISNATINYQPGDIGNIPVIFDENLMRNVQDVTKENIELSKNVWDASETS